MFLSSKFQVYKYAQFVFFIATEHPYVLTEKLYFSFGADINNVDFNENMSSKFWCNVNILHRDASTSYISGMEKGTGVDGWDSL